MNLVLEPKAHAVWQRLIGTVIADKYRLDELLGAGSQGLVWKAHNLDLDLPVAIKLMHPSSELSAELALSRLFREARAAASLGHPGIVRIFDFGRTTDGLSYLTMELLQGVSLGRHLEEVPKLSPELAVRLILPIADALSAAHAQGIVHRDVKPDNILLSVSAGRMQPKLLDFGIARVSDGHVLTQAGCVVGTPSYLPPEQARGLDEIDARSDVWALCATLYECVTGALPFPAPTWIDVLRRILEEEPEPISTHGINDPELWELIRKGLAKQPDERWSSMQEFARAASRWLLARKVSCDICGVSVESRWLRPPAAAKLANGATSSGVAWWEPAPSASSRRRFTIGRRPMLALSDVLLCIVAAVGVARAGVFPSAPPQDLATDAAPSACSELVADALPLLLPELVTFQPAKTAEHATPPNQPTPEPRVEPVRGPDVPVYQRGTNGETHRHGQPQEGSIEPQVSLEPQVAAVEVVSVNERSPGLVHSQTDPALPNGASRALEPKRHPTSTKPTTTSARNELDLMAAY